MNASTALSVDFENLPPQSFFDKVHLARIAEERKREILETAGGGFPTATRTLLEHLLLNAQRLAYADYLLVGETIGKAVVCQVHIFVMRSGLRIFDQVTSSLD